MVTPEEFFHACTFRSWTEVSQLLQAGAQIHWTCSKGLSALHYASVGNQLTTAYNLLQNTPHRNRMDINSICHEGETALHVACSISGDEKMVKLLLDLGADVNAVNSQMETPLYMACSRGFLRVVQRLLFHPDVNVHVADDKGFSPFDMVCYCNHTAIARAFLKHRPEVLFQEEENKIFHPLHVVCAQGNVNILKLILQTGVDVNLLDQFLSTPLHHACLPHPVPDNNPWGASRTAAASEDSVRTLIAAGADVRHSNSKGQTPLHCAIIAGNLTIVQLLIKAGADVNALDIYGNPPLTFLDQSKESFLTLFQTLLEHGVELSSVSRSVSFQCGTAKDSVVIAMLVHVFSESLRSRGLCGVLNACMAGKLCSAVSPLCSRMWRPGKK